MPPRKPTPAPKSPALVRTGVAAMVVGFGLVGAACGDEIVAGDGGAPQPLPPTPAGGGDGSPDDDVFDPDGTTGSDVLVEGGISPTPSPMPIFPPAPQTDSSFEDSTIIPLPPPHP